MKTSSDTRSEAQEKARAFVENEREFHLGFLPTEQPHPLTRHLSTITRNHPIKGVQAILAVDAELSSVARRAVFSPEFDKLVAVLVAAVRDGRTVCFSGCGSTGRLSVILEAMWRTAFRENEAADRCISIMTGGERALIRSVENFEDYAAFGARQVADAGLSEKDVLIAMSEGGETSSVIGTVEEGVRRGCTTFFIYNNPTELLRRRITRSRNVIEHPDVTKIDLFSGSMALSGSTRMQATTLSLLVVGTALEEAHYHAYETTTRETKSQSYRRLLLVNQFTDLVSQLRTEPNSEAIARLAELEATLYRRGGIVTYFASEYLLDIFSDTTERSPTFMLPPFRPRYDRTSPPAWSYAKDPTRPAAHAWNAMLNRAPRGLDWTRADYEMMGAPLNLQSTPPKLDQPEIYAYEIGTEEDNGRLESTDPAAVWVRFGSSALELPETAALSREYLSRFRSQWFLSVVPENHHDEPSRLHGEHVKIVVPIPESRSDLMSHLAVKIIFNTFSTVSMALLGRVEGSWMIQVNPTNKKLIDRASRIISHLTGTTYEESCTQLFDVLEEDAESRAVGIHPSVDSPVVRILKRYGSLPGSRIAP